MFREILDKLEGRKKTLDENLSIEEVITLLSGLNGNVRGDIHYYRYTSWGASLCSGSGWEKIHKLSKVAQRVMVDIINDKFGKEDKEHYTDIRHQVYSGSVDERHYLNFARGKIKKKYGIIVRKEGPDIKASIKFIVEKKLPFE